MMAKRITVIGATASLLVVIAAVPAVASDQESGSLACQGAQMIWITERTGPGWTTINWRGSGTSRQRVIPKHAWSTTITRTGLRAAVWRVTTTGQMDHRITGASCH